MKDLNEYIINESKFKDNLHDNMLDIENFFTNKLSELIEKNNTLKIEVDGVNVEFLQNEESDNEYDSEIYSAAGVLIERYLTSLLNKEIQSEKYFGSDLEQMLIKLKDIDNGSYENFDFEMSDVCFEIKCYHKNDNDGIWLSNKQKSTIGDDAFFILVNVAVSKNLISIKDVVIRQRKNLQISGNYIKGAK